MPFEDRISARGTMRPGLYILLLAVLGLAFHYRILFSGSQWILGGLDYINQYYGFKRLIVSEYRSGSFPLWNPYQFAGMPLLAVPWSGALYPIDPLFLAFSAFTALKISVVIHTVIMGLGMFYWSRESGVSAPGSFFAAAAYALCPHFFWQVGAGHISENIAGAWIPIIFLCCARFLKGRGARWVILGAGALAMALLGGNYQYIYYGLTALGVWLLARGLMDHPRNARRWALVFVCIGSVVLISLALCSAQLLPVMELFRESSRSAATRETAAVLSFQPDFYLGLVFPLYNRLTYECIPYFGLAPLGFSIVGLWSRRRLGQTLPLAAAGLVTAIMMMGSASPFFELLFRFFPMYKYFRIHASAAPVLIMLLCPLAGMGFDGLFSAGIRRAGAPGPQVEGERIESRKSRNTALVIFSLMGLIITLFWSLGWFRAFGTPGVNSFSRALYVFAYGGDWRVFMPMILIGAVIVLLAAAGKTLNPKWLMLFLFLTAADLFLIGPGHIRMKGLKEYQQLGNGVLDIVQKDSTPGDQYRIWAQEEILSPIQSIYLGISNVNGYCSLNVHRFRRYVFTALGARDNPRYTHPYPIEMFRNQQEDFPLRMLNVKYRGVYFPATDEMAMIVDETYLPRAFWVGRWRVAVDEETALKYVTARGFDAGAEAVLESPPPFDPQEPEHSFQAAVMIDYKPRSMELEIDAPGHGVLVISEVFYPGWRAFVDGESTPVERVDYTLRGLFVKKGTHRIRLEYRPESFYLGGIISLGALILCCLALTVGMVSGKRKNQAKSPPPADAAPSSNPG